MAWTYTPPSPEEITSGGAALREYVGAQADETTFSEEKFTEAHALVHQYAHGAAVPAGVLTEAIKEVGSKLWARRAVQGNTGFGGGLEAVPQFAAKDPLVTVYATLDRYLFGGFA